MQFGGGRIMRVSKDLRILSIISSGLDDSLRGFLCWPGPVAFRAPRWCPCGAGGAAVCSGGAVPSLEHALCIPLAHGTRAGRAVAGGVDIIRPPRGSLPHRRENQNQRDGWPQGRPAGAVGRLPCVQAQGQSGGQRARGPVVEGSKVTCPRRGRASLRAGGTWQTRVS